MTEELIKPEAAIKFLREASIYFQSRATHHEDSNIQSNMANAKTCERISEMIEARLIPVLPAVSCLA